MKGHTSFQDVIQTTDVGKTVKVELPEHIPVEHAVQQVELTHKSIYSIVAEFF